MAANQSDPVACAAHGSDPQLLVEPTVRECVYTSVYWRARCLGLNAAGVVHLACRLRYVGGAYGASQAPTPFLCLLLKLLQIGPEPELVSVYLEQKDYKYARVLGAFYTRLVRRSAIVYKELEPLLADHRKVVLRISDYDFELTHIDELIDQLLNENVVCGITLPHLTERKVLVESGALQIRKSQLPPEDLAALDAAAANDVDDDDGDNEEDP